MNYTVSKPNLIRDRDISLNVLNIIPCASLNIHLTDIVSHESYK